MRMRILLAVAALMLVFGPILLLMGWQEWRESKDATPEGAAFELAALEAGQRPENNHVILGEHYACYQSAVMEWTDRAAAGRPKPETKLSACYYPIISPAHPDTGKLEEMAKEAGWLDKINPEGDLPKTSPDLPITSYSVVIKTRRFGTQADIPSEPILKEGAIQGMMYKTRGIGAQEKRLLGEKFKNVDWNKVVIIEEGRKPASASWCWSLMVAGGALLLGGLGGGGFLVLTWIGVLGGRPALPLTTPPSVSRVERTEGA